MVNVEQVLQAVQECNAEGRNKTLAEFIASLFKDQFIELYLGDSYEEVKTEQISTSYPAVFVGKVVAAYRECLVIDCPFVEGKGKSPKLGHLMFINERAIRGLTEVSGKGVFEDLLQRSKDSIDIKNMFEK